MSLKCSKINYNYINNARWHIERYRNYWIQNFFGMEDWYKKVIVVQLGWEC